MNVFRTGFHVLVSMALGDLRGYAEEMEQVLESKVRKLTHEYNEKIAEIEDEEHREWLTENAVGDLHYLEDVYPTILRSSLLLSIYTVVEKHLNDLCRFMELNKKN